MTIYATLLSRGYFPKELPPAFFSEEFAAYATTPAGRKLLKTYKPSDNLTELVTYRLALPGQAGLSTRPLSIPHPWAYATVAGVVAKHFRRLLKKAAASKFSKSRPVYTTIDSRAIRTLVKPSNLARERALVRAGATHLLRVDISQFYPSLYTHAVGWAIDSKLRDRKHWKNKKLLGHQVDQYLMNMQGKVSQGIPIGNDVSFLLAEIVLAQVDKGLKIPADRVFRWYDDYEVACSSRQEAEEVLVRLNRLLESFRLRLNPKKTQILDLPQPAGDVWQAEILRLSAYASKTPANMVTYFDHAYRLSASFPERPVLMYAIGTLFKIASPPPDVFRVVQSCVTQAVLAEPGCAQKAFALLTFWEINGRKFDRPVLAPTIDRLIQMHESRAVSSDLAWALAFCIEHGVLLSRRSGASLARLEDDAVALLALHANGLGLTPGFSAMALARLLKTATCEGRHWLLLYEAVRKNYLPALQPLVSADGLFGDMLGKNVSFYREKLPAYAPLVHPGGAPEWVIRTWIKSAARPEAPAPHVEQPVPDMISRDLVGFDFRAKSSADAIRELLDLFIGHPMMTGEPYE